jgi:hypothetical protein
MAKSEATALVTRQAFDGALQIAGTLLDVDGRRLDRVMPHQRRDGDEVDTGVERTLPERVLQRVRRDAIESRPPRVLLDDVLDRLRLDTRTPLRDEKVLVGDLRLDVKVLLNGPPGIEVQGHDAVLTPLPAPDHHASLALCFVMSPKRSATSSPTCNPVWRKV